MSDNLFTDDDVTAAREALVKRWCEPSNGIDGIVRHVLAAVAPSIAARAVEPYRQALAELRADQYQRLRDRADQIEGKT